MSARPFFLLILIAVIAGQHNYIPRAFAEDTPKVDNKIIIKDLASADKTKLEKAFKKIYLKSKQVISAGKALGLEYTSSDDGTYSIYSDVSIGKFNPLDLNEIQKKKLSTIIKSLKINVTKGRKYSSYSGDVNTLIDLAGRSAVVFTEQPEAGSRVIKLNMGIAELQNIFPDIAKGAFEVDATQPAEPLPSDGECEFSLAEQAVILIGFSINVEGSDLAEVSKAAITSVDAVGKTIKLLSQKLAREGKSSELIATTYDTNALPKVNESHARNVINEVTPAFTEKGIDALGIFASFSAAFNALSANQNAMSKGNLTGVDTGLALIANQRKMAIRNAIETLPPTTGEQPAQGFAKNVEEAGCDISNPKSLFMNKEELALAARKSKIAEDSDYAVTALVNSESAYTTEIAAIKTDYDKELGAEKARLAEKELFIKENPLIESDDEQERQLTAARDASKEKRLSIHGRFYGAGGREEQAKNQFSNILKSRGTASEILDKKADSGIALHGEVAGYFATQVRNQAPGIRASLKGQDARNDIGKRTGVDPKYVTVSVIESFFVSHWDDSSRQNDLIGKMGEDYGVGSDNFGDSGKDINDLFRDQIVSSLKSKMRVIAKPQEPKTDENGSAQSNEAQADSLDPVYKESLTVKELTDEYKMK